ncbi:hypothetical protein D9B98_10150 [Corynebacterium diphtheriae]|nr:hypothetical protein BVL37_08715 [Corynebacterium diphtheriae]RKW83162.1 hypothetical protein D9B95_10290 [Corynebacterium diphtheriae]RKX06274.1 hypothetical protein D9B98_10150 [Corynebacterium diphtheriae]RNF46624.1 hypothetical protein EFE11_10295 [Corynebacterium diphtheriae]CAB0663051.1 hypothetical protein CIP107573_01944 [Corynebacterium diphtheriae]
MFKRSLASLAAVAVVSGVVVAPANAMSAKFNNNNMTCTISFTTEEANFIRLTSPATLSKQQATFFKTQYGETQLSALRAKIKEDEEKLAKLIPGTENEMVLKRKLEEKRKQLAAYQKFSDALKACIDGRNYDSDKTAGPSEPSPSEPSPNNPERERALPSTNGAVIGVIVAVLGILAAALPVIKSILRALLP